MRSAKILYISVHSVLSHAIRLFLLSDTGRKLDISIVSVDEVLRMDIKDLIADPPDLILFPVGFPGNLDLHLVGKHRAAGVKAPVIILCPPQFVPSFEELMENEVQGIISTSLSLEELREFIYAVLDGQPGTLKEQYARATAAMHLAAQAYGLTDREVAILHLLSAGINDDDVAKKLEISPKTVRAHLNRINIKLEAKNRLQAVVIAISKGIISPYNRGL